MTHYGSKELADSVRTVRKNTIIIAEEIPEKEYGFRAAPETRTVAQTLVHLAMAPRMAEQIQFIERRTTLEGFDFSSFVTRMIAAEQVAHSKAELLAMLRDGGEKFAQLVEKSTDDFLAERVTFSTGVTPPSKTRFEMLLSVKEHEMHHRGQLMLIERMVGIVPHLTREMQTRIAAMQAGKGNT